ncbi:MAG TPA: CHAT domain-containing protein, partial [Terracidiphilus sp.]
LAEGRRRLQALEQKFNQLKSHQSRIDQYLATPQAMRALAADPATLAGIDEELSSPLLPRLLDTAFPRPVDRSRGSPCADDCQAARTLLHSLAASLERNHQDPWLTQLLPLKSSFSDSSPADPHFIQAIHALAQGISADVLGDFPTARQRALEASQLFHALHNPAGEDRAQVEQSYALVRSSKLSGCYQAVHPVLGRNPQFQWIQIHALTQETLCDPAPGTASENNPGYLRAIGLAHDRGYTLLELRARNLLGSAAVDSGDAEGAWRVDLPTVRRFYTGDFAPIRLYGTLSGLEQVEETTPRVRLTLLLQREAVAVLELTQARHLIPTERFKLASVAIRAGSIAEALEQTRLAQGELAANGGGASVKSLLAENEIALAGAYLDRQDLSAAAKMLDVALEHMAGEQNSYHRRDYAVARGRLELAQGHLETAEPLLLSALVEEERLAGKDGTAGIVLAQQDRDLYAVLAGVWLAEGRSGQDVLALWERYRLRILGIPVTACPDKGLACLQPELAAALKRLGPDRMLGQLVLPDRLLLYRASAGGVVWLQVPVHREEVQAAADPLERAVSSPATPMDAVDRAERRAGAVLLDPLQRVEPLDGSAGQSSHLLIESDPLLGNLPWPSAATAAGPIGLQFNLEESPSLLLDHPPAAIGPSAAKPPGSPLIVGASVASGESQFLPEALSEARAVARFGNNPNLLLGDHATQPQVTARLATAAWIHFAGHAAQWDGAARLLLAPARTAPSATNPAGGSDKETSPETPWLDSGLLRRHPPHAARLAVFSACSTGKKEEGWNHGMGDIVDTLAGLGVPEVVATRWKIDSASAVPLMDAFYGGLARGLSVPMALTAARQSLVRDARYRHPYYWAAWYASGTGKSDFSALFHAAK